MRHIEKKNVAHIELKRCLIIDMEVNGAFTLINSKRGVMKGCLNENELFFCQNSVQFRKPKALRSWNEYVKFYRHLLLRGEHGKFDKFPM